MFKRKSMNEDRFFLLRLLSGGRGDLNCAT
jgi:hypothetical protein